MPHIELPPVTDAHRRAAFALFRWPGVTYEQAMAVDIRRRLVEACAHGIRTREHRAQAKAQRTGMAPWCQHIIFGPQNTPAPAAQQCRTFDAKRAAAHDIDD